MPHAFLFFALLSWERPVEDYHNGYLSFVAVVSFLLHQKTPHQLGGF